MNGNGLLEKKIDVEWITRIREMPNKNGFSCPVFEWTVKEKKLGIYGATIRALPITGLLVFDIKGTEFQFDSLDEALFTIEDECGWDKPPYIDEVFRDISEAKQKFPTNDLKKTMEIFAELRQKWEIWIKK